MFSRRIIGWQTADHLRTDLPLDALEMALFNRSVHTGQTIHHSDAGSQYTSIRYTTRLSDVGVMPSVGTVADSYDKDLVSYCTSLRWLDGFAVSEWASLPGDQAFVAAGGDFEEPFVFVGGLVGDE